MLDWESEVIEAPLNYRKSLLGIETLLSSKDHYTSPEFHQLSITANPY